MFFKKNKAYQYNFKEITFSEWEIFWKKILHNNLLQSWHYGNAKQQSENWNIIRYVIQDSFNTPIAIIQVLTRKYPFIGGIARINRGPLLLKDYQEEEKIEIVCNILNCLLRELRINRCWILQIAPELPDTIDVRHKLNQIGLHKMKTIPWASAIIDLSENKDTLLMKLNGKWRNCLRKGEKSGVIVKKVDLTESNFKFLISSYNELQNNRSFQGLSTNLIIKLAQDSDETWDFNLFFAWQSNDIYETNPIGQLVSIRSGDTTMYLIGTTNQKGREIQANSVLLWRSILYAQETGSNWFDLGGLNSATPKGIAEFKKGLNALPYSLIGEYRGVTFF